MGANIAGIYGAQIFREDDNPLDLRRRRRDARRAPDVGSEVAENSGQKWQNVDSLSSSSASPPNGEAALVGVGAAGKK
jgi:hypothetical protein